MENIDWEKIKEEYILTKTTYEKLAEKYGIKRSEVFKKSKEEAWRAKRRLHRAGISVDCMKRIESLEEKEEGSEENAAEKIRKVSDKLLEKLVTIIDSLSKDEVLSNKQLFKSLSATLKDIKDIQGIKTEKDDSVSQITVKIEGGDERWQE